ncbi:MAG TPA: apolipoprotein N-acyltransferase [Acetobacteraceae bacterium]
MPVARMLGRLAALYGWRANAVAFGLGVVAALALPPLYGVPVLLLAFPGLLALLDGAPRPSVAAWRGWWFGFGLNLVGLYWITEAILVDAAQYWWLVPLAVPAVSAIMALFIAAATSVARLARPGWPRALALAGGWVLADIAREFVGTGFPWNPLGSVWEFPGRVGDVFIQPGAWIGIDGITLLTVLLASAPARGWRWRSASVAVFAAWIVAGVARLQQPVPIAPPLHVVLVQGDVAEGQKWDSSLLLSIFQRYLRLTREGVAQAGSGPAVVVWPETAFPFTLAQEPGARQLISQATEGAPALIGSVRYDRDRRPRNSMFALVDSGTIAAVYDKWHLVPFGEYQPDWLPIGIQVVPGGGFARGPGPRTLHVPGLPPLGPLICYEAIFSGEITDEADRPDWLVNITNDAWFGDSTGPRQHLAAARMRAVEEGLPLMRAANTGISAAFDAKGRELTHLGIGRMGFLVVSLPAPVPRTLFARFGLLIPGGAATVLLCTGLLTRRISARG